MIDLTKLSHMRMLARYGSFVRAAEAIFITQPALSRSIKSLEDAYDVTLFVRNRGGVTLTPEGQQFLLQAESLLAHAEAVEQDLNATATGELHVVPFGIGPMAGSMLLDDLLASVLRNGTFAVSVRIGSTRDLRALLLNGEIEFFVGSLPRSTEFTRSQNLDYQPLSIGDVGLFVRHGHPLTLEPDAKIRTFPLICGTFVRQIIGSTNLDAAGLPQPLLELDDYDLLLRLAATSDSLLIASRGLLSLRDEYNFVEIRASIGTPIEAGIVTVNGRTTSQSARKLIDYFAAGRAHATLVRTLGLEGAAESQEGS